MNEELETQPTEPTPEAPAAEVTDAGDAPQESLDVPAETETGAAAET